MKSHSWFVDIKKLFIKYELGNPYEYLLCSDYTKLKWKNMINKKVNIYWTERISFEAKMFKSLQHLGCLFQIGQCHPHCKNLYCKQERYIQNTNSAENSNRIIYSTNQESCN